MHCIYPWQQQEWQYIFNRKNSGKLPHAILIQGTEGLGKYHFAQCIAELLLCQKKDTQACGKCSACQLLESNNHPDLIIIRPEEKNKVIKIEQIRNLVAELNHTSQQGGYKVAIIEHAELLNIAAANSLLKTLEEPASDVIIILVSPHPAVLAATIRSRCQIISMKIPSYVAAQEWLLKQEVETTEFQLVLALAENAPLKALEFTQEKSNLHKRQEFFQHLHALQNEKLSTIQAAEQLLAWDLRFLLTTFMYIVSDIIKIKFTEAENVMNQDQIQELRQWATKTNLNRLFTYYAYLLELQRYIFRNINLNQQLLAENLTIAWAELFTKEIDVN